MFTHVTGPGLAHLQGLTNLSKLELSYSQVTGDGLAFLKGQTAPNSTSATLRLLTPAWRT